MLKDLNHQILAEHAYAVIDPSVIEFIPDGITSVPIVPAKMPASAHLMPSLVHLGALPADAKEALLRLLHAAWKVDAPPLVPMLIRTDAVQEDLCRHWNRLQLIAPTPSRKLWLRAHDPRVLHQLLRILTAPQRIRLFGPVERYTYWAGGAWHADTAASPAKNTDTKGGVAWPWKRVEQIGLINRAIQAADLEHSAMLDQHSEAAEVLIAIATNRFGLAGQADLVEFAMRGITCSPRFYDDPVVSEAIRPARNLDSTLADRLALIDERVWMALA
ncbi:MAG: DUF4123 domain-containing protein [Telluria sp.]